MKNIKVKQIISVRVYIQNKINDIRTDAGFWEDIKLPISYKHVQNNDIIILSDNDMFIKKFSNICIMFNEYFINAKSDICSDDELLFDDIPSLVLLHMIVILIRN